MWITGSPASYWGDRLAKSWNPSAVAGKARDFNRAVGMASDGLKHTPRYKSGYALCLIELNVNFLRACAMNHSGLHVRPLW